MSVEALRGLRWSRSDKAWPLSFATIGIQGELGDQQHTPADIGDRAVHTSLLVRKYPVGQYLFQQLLASREIVVPVQPQQYQHGAQRGGLGAGLDTIVGIGHAQDTEPGRKQEYRADQDDDAANQFLHDSIIRACSA